jgi:hypothetical protein
MVSVARVDELDGVDGVDLVDKSIERLLIFALYSPMMLRMEEKSREEWLQALDVITTELIRYAHPGRGFHPEVRNDG